MCHVLALTPQQRERLSAHLLPDPPVAEEVAFLFARVHAGSEGFVLEVEDLHLVEDGAFRSRGIAHLQVEHDFIGRMIKRAHDLGTALVEAHSHPFEGLSAARFSPSDRAGLAEIVPHVLWRLPGRPYAALVFAPEGTDGLLWPSHGAEPEQITELRIGGQAQRTSLLTLPAWRQHGPL